ncbi:hypothetical protein FG167_14350 [Lacinutrix sp. WUR7]|uniref:putative metal-binding motif-containing protein n=1 Tax=Lacinutrix sp. WUR7 TaxID=2653681 RepID=UPI00193D0FC6|nr:putative metal-binding motif-containing protein [Lacinutrix sp. WUR7]QRM90368.1 hypothetical protein FG167_14350 [Lacinutrix sp. WUR7]
MTKRKTIYLLAFLTIGIVTINSCSKDDDCSEQTWYQDNDGDGFGNPSSSQKSCNQPSGYVTDNTDFDDNNTSAYPNAVELCNGIDDNGNGTIDENPTDCGFGEVCENGSCTAAVTYYKDNDSDLFGNPGDTIIAGSTAPIGYVIDNTDCNDNDANTYPGAPENTTDGVDNNCNGYTDETLCTTDADCPNACIDQGNGIWICQ